MAARLPAALEVSALLRQTQAAGGFAMVLHKGEPDSGTILVVLLEAQGPGRDLGRLFERMPGLDGTRKWTCTRTQDAENNKDFNEYLERRVRQDPDVWMIELTIADGERFILNEG